MKTVLITGASRGIGRAIAKLFAAQEYNVVINYCKNAEGAAALEREINASYPHALALRADVADRAQVDDMVRRSLERFGRVDVLVNNAGIARQELLSDVREEEWDRMFDVNVKGMFHCTQAVLPGMLRAKRGKIVNLSSVWGLTGASCEVCYSASKAAVIGFTRALAKEVGPSGIQVNCVAPGVIATDMNEALDDTALAALLEETPLGRIGSPCDVAQAVLFLASDQADFITGQVLSPNGGFAV